MQLAEDRGLQGLLGEVELSAGDAASSDQGAVRRAFIVGLGGYVLSDEERRFLDLYRPCGIILFTRNFSSNAQVRRLIDDASVACGEGGLLVLVDQEGGRVQRLRGPEWPDFPAAAAFGALYQRDARAGRHAAEICAQWLCLKLREVGINANCVPCLDLPVAGADAIIGDRAYGTRSDPVVDLGGAVARGAMAAGVLPVMKHIPGHGRAAVDSHLALPLVETALDTMTATDFEPFKALKHLPAAMSAHITYAAIDATAAASVSRVATERIIRGAIGFDGLLMSDDISMQALAGSIDERARAVISAGSDVILHCNGDLHEMHDVGTVAPELKGAALRRYRDCLAIVARAPVAVDDGAVRAALALVDGR